MSQEICQLRALLITYNLPYLAHACMEVLNCTVRLSSLCANLDSDAGPQPGRQRGRRIDGTRGQPDTGNAAAYRGAAWAASSNSIT